MANQTAGDAPLYRPPPPPHAAPPARTRHIRAMLARRIADATSTRPA